jgi:hypothetical protein
MVAMRVCALTVTLWIRVCVGKWHGCYAPCMRAVVRKHMSHRKTS